MHHSIAPAVRMLGGALLCFASVLVLPAFARAAAAEGWLQVSSDLAGGIDFTPHGSQPGLANSLLFSDTCSACHGASGPGGAVAFRPHSTWGGSMMANSTRDPLFFAALDVANIDVPGVGDWCLRCHSTDGWYGGRVVKAGYGQPDHDVDFGAAGCLLEGSYDAPDANSDYGGISCHFCHRNEEQGPNGEPLARNGAVWLDDGDCNGRGEPCRHGPYSYAGAQPPHAWKQSSFISDSAMCGQCHDVNTPDTSAGPLKTLKLVDGTDTGIPFPIDRTYTEWQRSAWSAPGGQSCQGCHMPSSEDPNASACALGGYPNRSGNLPVHSFAGGNTWILDVIRGEYSDTSAIPGSWGGIGREESFAQSIDWSRQLLQSAATLEIAVDAFLQPRPGANGRLGFVIEVTNLSGHKLPTGFGDGRRMWLNVEVRDRDGALVAESAAYDAATGYLDEDPRAQVYEVKQGIWNHLGNGDCDTLSAAWEPMFHTALSDCIAKDNRIPPLGFTPASTEDPEGYEVRPVAADYPETTPGSGVLVNYAQAPYRFDIPALSPGPFSIQARLYYQTASKEYVEFLRDEAVADGVDGENQLCAGGPARPFVVGPKERARGVYLYALWGNEASDPLQPGYGKSPPEAMAVESLAGDWIFVDGFDIGW